MNEKTKNLSTPKEWNLIWGSNFDHYQNDTRHAYYINAVRQHNEKQLLEIAAGSFRDIAKLEHSGLEVYGMDFSNEAVKLARLCYPQLANRFTTMDAFNLDYDDKSFDMSYHNGFWGYFSDLEVKKLAAEQARVTRNRIIATVHNAHNKSFKNYFLERKEQDPLFDIRFFEIDEITDLMKSTCSNVKVIPVGKGKKSHEDWLINNKLGHPALIRACFKISGCHLLERSERLLCIGEI